MAKTTALAKQPETPTALAIAGEELDEMFGDSQLDTHGLSFNVVKIVRETAQFEVREGEYVPSMVGHILYKHQSNQWWEVGFDQRKEGDDPMPTCYSIDGIKASGGTKMQSEFCAMCPLNKFGSAGDGKKGKACRNTVRFVFLEDGAVLPVILTAPPTSLGKKSSLQSWLNDIPNRVGQAFSALKIKNGKGGPVVDYWTAHVELTLEKEKFESGVASILKIKTLDVVTPDTPENANKLRTLFQIVRGAKEAYQHEIEAYLTAEVTEVNTPDEYAGGGEYNDNDEIPI